MMQQTKRAGFQAIVVQLILILLIFQAMRLLFFVINHGYFHHVGFAEYLRLAFYGIRFDLSTTFGINLCYLVLALLPFRFTALTAYQFILRTLFILTNSVAFLFELSDIGYFPYVRHRMSAEVFHLLGRKSDFIDLLPSYLREFWFVPLLAIILVTCFVWLNRKIIQRFGETGLPVFSMMALLRFVVLLAIALTGIRGGWQLKPIMNINALLVTSNERTPLVLNTTFSILHTLQEKKLEPLHFFNDQELKAMFDMVKHVKANTGHSGCNVVVIILESFGKQYTGIGGRKSYTPFLDSLMGKSLVFTQAFANGHRSADGIPACLAGIPAFMEESFTTSPYADNTIDALPALLRKTGYHTSFFHGGTNGTMSFDIFARGAGFERYVGRSEYGNDADYDGTWGIWDEPFLQYVAGELGKEKQPFFSSVFTLSSHEPFSLPAKYDHTLWTDLKGITKGVAYSDMALRRFFQTASKQPWYRNTLFVITADHNYLANKDSLGYYNNGIGLYAIPLLFYRPGDQHLQGYSSRPAQQIDILPSVLQYIGYHLPFFAYGNSVFDSLSKPFVYNQMGDHHQFMFDGKILVAEQTRCTGIFSMSTDSLMQFPLTDTTSGSGITGHFRAFKQLLQNTIIANRQSIRTYIASPSGK